MKIAIPVLLFGACALLSVVVARDMPTERICYLFHDLGTCNPVETAWYYHPPAEKCSSYQDGGCGRSENKFDSRAACEQKCILGSESPSPDPPAPDPPGSESPGSESPATDSPGSESPTDSYEEYPEYTGDPEYNPNEFPPF